MKQNKTYTQKHQIHKNNNKKPEYMMKNTKDHKGVIKTMSKERNRTLTLRLYNYDCMKPTTTKQKKCECYQNHNQTSPQTLKYKWIHNYDQRKKPHTHPPQNKTKHEHNQNHDQTGIEKYLGAKWSKRRGGIHPRSTCVSTWQRVTQTIWGRGTTPYRYRNKEAEVKHLLPEANNHKTRPTKTKETWTIHGTINGNAQGLQVNSLHLNLSWVPIYRCLYRRSHCSWSVHPTQQDLDWNQQEQFTLLSEIMPVKRG